MSTATIIEFLKKLLPMDRIAAWILGVITVGLAMFFGAGQQAIKEKYCASANVELPKIEAPVAPTGK